MSRNLERAESEDSRTSSHSGCALRRKQVAPGGYLSNLLTAKHTLKSMGIKQGSKATECSSSSNSRATSLGRPPRRQASSGGSSRGPGGAAAAGQELLYVPPPTLPLLFAQRKKFLQRSKLRGTPQPYRLNEELPVGLLSLPEDVLLKIMCYLHHSEIKPLFLVCKQLTHTLKTAVQFHFNYATPFRHTEEQALPLPRPERNNKKRSATNLAAVLSHLTRSGRLTAEARAASGHTTAPRALFADGAGASREGGSMRVAALAV